MAPDAKTRETPGQRPARAPERQPCHKSGKTGPHQLTYRQVEHTFGLVADALAKDDPGGAPAEVLQTVCDLLLEASIPAWAKEASTSLAADWTDTESWSRPPRHATTACHDPEASWGHRNTNLPGPRGEMFFGYYLSALTMAGKKNGPAVPELTPRITVCSCRLDPARAQVPVLEKMPADGIPLGDIITDSGYSHRVPGDWATPLRRAGATLVQDLHPSDRGPQGTHHQAVVCNGNLYCPGTPQPLLQPGPPPPGAPAGDAAAHDQQTAELARYKLGRHTTADADGYHRVTCPAVPGKIRCPLRPDSMTLDRDRPEILSVPEHPPACCTHQTITAGPGVAAKTRHKHNYPPAAWRRSYARRTTAERSLFHHQGPRHHQHRPPLAPPHRPHRDHAVDRLPARRPHPAHPRPSPSPPGRQRPPCRRRPPAQNTPQTPRRPAAA